MADEKRTHQVTLGCGTLILIALIVMFFSRPGIGELQQEVQHLRTDIGELRRSVEAQTTQIKVLQEKVEKGQR
jgi:hypothetical protein